MEDIQITTVQRKTHQYICPICNKILIDFEGASNHFKSHVLESELTQPVSTFTCPCGCTFNDNESAKEHIDFNRKRCGYYYRKDSSSEILMQIVHIKFNSFGTIEFKGYVMEINEKGINIQGGRDCCNTKHILSAKRNSNSIYKLRIESGFEKISEKRFEELYKEMSVKMMNQIINFKYGSSVPTYSISTKEE